MRTPPPAVHTGLLKSGLLARNRDLGARVHARTQQKAKRRLPAAAQRLARRRRAALPRPGDASLPRPGVRRRRGRAARALRVALVRDEAAALGARRLQQYRDHDDALLHENGDWSVHYLSLEGYTRRRSARRRRSRRGSWTRSRRTTGHAFLSVLAPGTHILPHCGPCNYRLRLQLGLRVPEAGPDPRRRRDARVARGRGARPRRRLRARGVERLGRAARHPDRRRVAPRLLRRRGRVDGGDAGGEAPEERRRRRDGAGVTRVTRSLRCAGGVWDSGGPWRPLRDRLGTWALRVTGSRGGAPRALESSVESSWFGAQLFFASTDFARTPMGQKQKPSERERGPSPTEMH